MPSPLNLQPNAIVHPEDAVSAMAHPKQEAHGKESKPTTEPAPRSSHAAAPQEPITSSVSLSFAFDTLTHSLNVVLTDKQSGDVVRKFSFKSLSTSVHKVEKLNGLLMDQFA